MSTREQFEKWFEEKYPNLHRAAIGRGSWSSEQRENASRKRHDLFALWQASRAAALEEAAIECAKVAGNNKDHIHYIRKGAGICEFHIRALAKAEGD